MLEYMSIEALAKRRGIKPMEMPAQNAAWFEYLPIHNEIWQEYLDEKGGASKD